MKVVAIVGMTGSGKSEAADFLVEKGFHFIRLGQLTLDEVKKRGLEPTEENEQPIREEIREKHGKAAYATLNFPKIDEMLKKGNVVTDNLMSWAEYKAFKKKYADNFIVLAVCASPETRYRRLAGRKYDPEKDPKMRNRPHPKGDAIKRDYAELENLEKGGPIAMADFTVVNEGTVENFKKNLQKILEQVRCG